MLVDSLAFVRFNIQAGKSLYFLITFGTQVFRGADLVECSLLRGMARTALYTFLVLVVSLWVVITCLQINRGTGFYLKGITKGRVEEKN
jgi:hypothetical protein